MGQNSKTPQMFTAYSQSLEAAMLPSLYIRFRVEDLGGFT